jgi:hypothetical protein
MPNASFSVNNLFISVLSFLDFGVPLNSLASGLSIHLSLGKFIFYE